MRAMRNGKTLRRPPWQAGLAGLLRSLGYCRACRVRVVSHAERHGTVHGCPWVWSCDVRRAEALLPPSPDWRARVWDQVRVEARA